MKIYTIFLFLALIVAVSATFHKKCHKKPHHLKKHGSCGVGKSYYLPPKHSSGKCLDIFGFYAKKVKPSLKHTISIFKLYSKRTIAKKLSVAIEVIINISKAISYIFDVWISNLGKIFSRLVIAIYRIIFCILDSPWDNGKYFDRWFSRKHCAAPSVCKKDFGCRYGWRKFPGKYVGFKSVLEFYEIIKIRSELELCIKNYNGVGFSGLKGTSKVVVEAMISLIDLACNLCYIAYLNGPSFDFIGASGEEVFQLKCFVTLDNDFV